MTPVPASGAAAGAASIGFGARLRTVLDTAGPLCVGVDPHTPLLSQWGLSDDATGAREFGLRVVDATVAGGAGLLKPQVAFFERFGAAGYAALEDVLAAGRAAGLLVIADGKRGDIGSTVAAAGEAWLTPGSPLEADAMTAVAYQGTGSLDDVFARAHAHGKGVFVLAATSNPESASIQTARDGDGRTVARIVADDLRARNGAADPATADAASGALGALGAVVGATVDLAALGLDADALTGIPLLAPGFGAQGVELSQRREVFGALAPNIVANVSRSVLGAGPSGIVEAIRRSREEVSA